MSNYYFLDTGNKPQGPFTLAELVEKLNAQELSLSTLISLEGETSWQSLMLILYPDQAKVPTRNIFQEWWYCIIHAFCFHGRASRKEFWSFTLLNGIIHVGLVIWILVIMMQTLQAQLEVIDLGYLPNDFSQLSKEFELSSMPNAKLLYDLFLLWFIITFIPSLSALWRRLHDIGKSGWYAVVLVIPILGSILYLFFTCSQSDPETNKYGPPTSS